MGYPKPGFPWFSALFLPVRPIAGRTEGGENEPILASSQPSGFGSPVSLVSPLLAPSEEELLWRFVDQAPVPLIAAGDDRVIKRINGRWSEVFGYTSDLVVGAKLDELLAPESKPGIAMRWSDLMASGASTARIAILYADGTRVEIRYLAVANAVPGTHLALFLTEQATPSTFGRPRGRRAGQLTLREQESLRLVALGLTTTGAAERLGISPETVRTHVRNAMNKLGARTRAQAIAVAMRDGEIPG